MCLLDGQISLLCNYIICYSIFFSVYSNIAMIAWCLHHPQNYSQNMAFQLWKTTFILLLSASKIEAHVHIDTKKFSSAAKLNLSSAINSTGSILVQIFRAGSKKSRTGNQFGIIVKCRLLCYTIRPLSQLREQWEHGITDVVVSFWVDLSCCDQWPWCHMLCVCVFFELALLCLARRT